MFDGETCASRGRDGRLHLGFAVRAGLCGYVPVLDSCPPLVFAPRSRSRPAGAEDGGAAVPGSAAVARIHRRGTGDPVDTRAGCRIGHRLLYRVSRSWGAFSRPERAVVDAVPAAEVSRPQGRPGHPGRVPGPELFPEAP